MDQNTPRVFFILHYGGFLTAYALFLFGITYTNAGWGTNVNTDQIVYIAIAISIFFVNHLMSYLHNQGKDAPNQHIGTIMFMPYARILPIHLTLLVGASMSGALILFLVLKTVADVVMHVIEHKVLAKHAPLTRV